MSIILSYFCCLLIYARPTAYDSVLRAALWRALQKYGVPDIMIDLIQSLHDGISAIVMVGGGRSKPFLV